MSEYLRFMLAFFLISRQERPSLHHSCRLRPNYSNQSPFLHLQEVNLHQDSAYLPLSSLLSLWRGIKNFLLDLENLLMEASYRQKDQLVVVFLLEVEVTLVVKHLHLPHLPLLLQVLFLHQQEQQWEHSLKFELQRFLYLQLFPLQLRSSP